MSTENRKPGMFTSNISVMFLVAMLYEGSAFADADTVVADPATELSRMSESMHFVSGGRSNDRDRSNAQVSEDAYKALDGGATRGNTATKLDPSAARSSSAQSASPDFWFYEADVVLFDDLDRDGYFQGIDLLFDVDTNFLLADVYAVVYLSFEGGPWNEYAVTEDFTINGSSSTDEFVLVTELLSGYPTGEYDLLIELFDAYDGWFLTSFGPNDTSELAYLPLEDASRDAVYVETVVVVTEGGGGAFGPWSLIALPFALLISRRKRMVASN